MIIKEVIKQNTDVEYQIFEVKSAIAEDGSETSIQSLKETVSVEDCEQRINQMTDEIVRATTERDKYEAILLEIKKL